MTHNLFRPTLVGSLIIGIGIVAIGAIALLHEPSAYADPSVSVSRLSGALAEVQPMAQAALPVTLEATVYRDPNCGCCEAWADHLEANGFRVSVIEEPDMDAVKQQHNVPAELASCHTAIINGAVVEGHVPAADIKQFLAHESEAIGLAVPGMPIGSPGMESGDTQQPFTVFSFDQDGNADAFNRYPS